MADIIATSEYEVVARVQLLPFEIWHDRQFRLSDGAVHYCNCSVPSFTHTLLRSYVLTFVNDVLLLLTRLPILTVVAPQVSGRE